MLIEYVAPRSWRPGWAGGLTNKTHCFYAYKRADLLKWFKIDSFEPKKGKIHCRKKTKMDAFCNRLLTLFLE